MDELSAARAKIDEIDSQMAELFKKRMEACADVASYKKENGLPIYDPEREKLLFDKRGRSFDCEELRGFYLSFLKETVEISKRWQRRLTEGMRVAYSGVKGAFAEIAADRIFPHAVKVGYGDFDAAYKAVENGDCDCAVLPLENSYAGTVGRVMDLMFDGDLFVSDVFTLPVVQDLLAVKGACVDRIRTVISHPQALAQCAGYINRMGFEVRACANTALAAKTVSEAQDETLAAIASGETAKLYGLAVLDHDLNESAQNSTRFAVLTRSFRKGGQDGQFILMFTVNDVAGALAGAIDVISRHGFNMRALKSRPVREKAWQYYFYVEAQGDETSPEGKRMLNELAAKCQKIKVAGHFGKELVLKEGDSF